MVISSLDATDLDPLTSFEQEDRKTATCINNYKFTIRLYITLVLTDGYFSLLKFLKISSRAFVKEISRP